MRTKSIILTALILLILAVSSPSASAAVQRPTFYTSEWVLVPPGSYHDFNHGFSERPLTMAIWVALKINEWNDSQLWTEEQYDIDALANSHFIRVWNRDSEDLMLQVVAQGIVPLR